MEFNRFKLNLDFTYHNNQIHLTANGQTKAKKKKITGSRLGAVLGVNEYQSPFQVWCDLLGFYSSEGERYFLEAGSIIEPKLNAYVQKQLQLKFKSYHPPAVGYDLFPNNPIFGGVPDGEPLGENNQLVFDHKHYLLEIKTASLDEYEWTKEKNEMVLVRDQDNCPIVKNKGTKIKKWIKNGYFHIPLTYQYQLALYLYLRKMTKGLFCVGFLQNKDYLSPQNYNPFDHDHNLVLLEEFQLDLTKFEQVINYATKWYQTYVVGGISPLLSTQDLQWFRYGYQLFTT